MRESGHDASLQLPGAAGRAGAGHRSGLLSQGLLPHRLVYRSNGDLYFTDPPFGLPFAFQDPDKELPYQGVYRVTPAGRVDLLTSELEAPNGIGFSPEEKTLYVANAVRQRPIWMAYPVLPDGTLGPGRQFAESAAWVKDAEGVNDGLKVDVHGNVWGAAAGDEGNRATEGVVS